MILPYQESRKWPVGKILVSIDGFSHLIIYVLNVSAWMTQLTEEKITKGRMVSIAVKNIFSRFKCSSKIRNFCFAIIYYDETARIELDITPATKVDEMRDYNAANAMGGKSSFVCEGLSLAEQIVQSHFSENNQPEIPKSASIVVLSTGFDSKQQEALDIAKSIKANPKIEIISYYIESHNETTDYREEMDNFYKEICSDKNYNFKKTKTSEELEVFLYRCLHGSGISRNTKI